MIFFFCECELDQQRNGARCLSGCKGSKRGAFELAPWELERVLAWVPCAVPPGADRTAPASKGRSWLGVNIVKLPSLLRQQ